MKRLGYGMLIAFIALIIIPAAILVLFMTLVGWVLGWVFNFVFSLSALGTFSRFMCLRFNERSIPG